MTTNANRPAISRRTAMAGLGAGGLGLALANRRSAAQDGADNQAAHPLVGTWAVLSTGGVVPQIHGADGSVIAAFTPNYLDPALGLTFQGAGLGRWEPGDEQSGPFTFFQALSNADGTYAGTFQLADTLTVSEDGQTWSGSDTARIIVRDAANNVLSDEMLSFGPPVTAHRITVDLGALVLPVATPTAATPET